jgi:peptidoglycan/xylan/chitin deacetylase (PgdA/CDA1 family)
MPSQSKTTGGTKAMTIEEIKDEIRKQIEEVGDAVMSTYDDGLKDGLQEALELLENVTL